LHALRKEHQLRFGVPFALLREQFVPNIFGLPEHDANESR
jgi:hypothetical protein